MKASASELNGFADLIRGAIDNADETPNNDGPMWQPYSRDNWRTATVEIKHVPPLAPLIQQYAPFEQGGPLSVSLRHFFDPRGADDIVFWVKGLDTPLKYDDNGHAEQLTAVSWLRPEKGSDRFFIQDRSAIDLSEDDFANLASQLLDEKIPELPGLIEIMGVRDALTLAVLKLREMPDVINMLTKDQVVKSIGNSAARNGFNLSAYEFRSESPKAPDTTHTYIGARLRLSFTGESYGGTFDGLLTKDLVVKFDKDGSLTEATRSSNLGLFDDPFPNGDTNVTLGNDYDKDETPEELRHLLYDDSAVTPEDIEYYAHLITEPISEIDAEIQPAAS